MKGQFDPKSTLSCFCLSLGSCRSSYFCVMIPCLIFLISCLLGIAIGLRTDRLSCSQFYTLGPAGQMAVMLCRWIARAQDLHMLIYWSISHQRGNSTWPAPACRRSKGWSFSAELARSQYCHLSVCDIPWLPKHQMILFQAVLRLHCHSTLPIPAQ